MSHVAIGGAPGRGSSGCARASSDRGRGAEARRSADRAPARERALVVARARRRIRNGFYENRDVIAAAFDRLIDDVGARLGRSLP